jgi:hypothetical protein
MKKILVIDSDDIDGLSEALREALERKGVQFRDGNFGYRNINDDYGGCGHSLVYSGGCGSGGCGISFGGYGTGGC